MLLQTIIEIVIAVALIIGLCNEDKIAAFERKAVATIKNGRGKLDRKKIADTDQSTAIKHNKRGRG